MNEMEAETTKTKAIGPESGPKRGPEADSARNPKCAPQHGPCIAHVCDATASQSASPDGHVTDGGYADGEHVAGATASTPTPSSTAAALTGKRLFIGLVLGAAALLCCLFGLLWLIPTLGFAGIHPWLPSIAAGICLAAMLSVLWVSLGLVYHAYTGRPIFGSTRMRGLSVRLFLPLAELLGRMLGLSVEKVRRSFIKVNNELVASADLRCAPESVLILLPHCLQASTCPHRLIHNPDNCTGCGACVHGGLLALRDKWGVRLAVATGGTIARRIVVQTRPRLIVAVACERDLAAGIQDTYPLPVFGILNERPHGPCLDTTLDLQLVEQALVRFVAPVPCVARTALHNATRITKEQPTAEHSAAEHSEPKHSTSEQAIAEQPTAADRTTL